MNIHILTHALYKIKHFDIKDPYREIKYFIQRGRRGYSDRDLWNLDFFISRILANGLLELANKGLGHPCRGVLPKDCENCTCEKDWDKELRENAEKFRLIAEDDWATVNELNILQQKETEALEWLSKNYRSLWD